MKSLFYHLCCRTNHLWKGGSNTQIKVVRVKHRWQPSTWPFLQQSTPLELKKKIHTNWQVLRSQHIPKKEQLFNYIADVGTNIHVATCYRPQYVEGIKSQRRTTVPLTILCQARVFQFFSFNIHTVATPDQLCLLLMKAVIHFPSRSCTIKC